LDIRELEDELPVVSGQLPVAGKGKEGDFSLATGNWQLATGN
jgi:hypothetical protein